MRLAAECRLSPNHPNLIGSCWNPSEHRGCPGDTAAPGKVSEELEQERRRGAASCKSRTAEKFTLRLPLVAQRSSVIRSVRLVQNAGCHPTVQTLQAAAGTQPTFSLAFRDHNSQHFYSSISFRMKLGILK